MPLRACMRCGSRELRFPSISSGDAYLPGTEEIMGISLCGTCGLKSVPFEFESEDAWRAFRGEREREGWTSWRVEHGQGMSPLPSAEALGKSRIVPGLLIAAGAVLAFAGLLGLATFAAGASLSGVTGIGPLLLGVPLVAIGLHLLRGRRTGPRSPGAG